MPLFPPWSLVSGPARLVLRAMYSYDVDVELAEGETARAAREREDEIRLERSRWLEEQRAERSFPCGLVPDPVELETGQPRLNVVPAERGPIQVTAAVLPDDVVFLRDGSDDVVEIGRLPRAAISGVDVVDEHDVHVPEPVRETIEPPQLCLLVLRWSNQGAADEDRFAFRSPWLAWRAGRRLMEARRG